MTYPSQFAEFLTVAGRDGEGGITAEPPSIILGERRSFLLSFPEDEEFGDWTDGVFTAVLRAAPGAAGDPLAEYTCVTGTPVGSLTPVMFDLLPAAQTGLADLVESTAGLGEVFFAVHFTPTGGSLKTLITTRHLVRGAI